MVLFIRDCIDNFIVCGYVYLDSDLIIGVRWYLRLCVLFCDKLVFLNVVKYVLMIIGMFVLIYINSCCIKILDKSCFILIKLVYFFFVCIFNFDYIFWIVR